MVHRGEYEIHPFTPTLSARATQTRVNLAGVHDRGRVVAPLVFVFGWSSWSAVWSPPHRETGVIGVLISTVGLMVMLAFAVAVIRWRRRW